VFQTRSRIVHAIREFMSGQGFPRGRDADDAADPRRRERPAFKTRHNSLDMDSSCPGVRAAGDRLQSSASSTSRKPLPDMNSRIACTMRLRVWNTPRVSSLMMRFHVALAVLLLLVREPVEFSGSGRSAFTSRRSSVTFRESSPVLVLKRVPRAPRMSPRS